MVPLASRKHHVVVHDQRGIGSSERGDAPCTVEQLADDCIAILDHLRIERAAVLGTSFGGLVAQQVAIAHPQRVAALIPCATGPGARHSERVPASDDALLGRGARTPADAYRIACTVLYSAGFRAAHPEFIEEQVRQRARRPVPPRVFREQFAASRSWDGWEGLPKILAPALVLHGTEDAIMPLANAQRLAERIPGSRHHWFEGAGHLFFHERPEETVAAVAGFLDSLR